MEYLPAADGKSKIDALAHAAIALAMDEFLDKLQKKHKLTPYPEADLEMPLNKMPEIT